MIKQTNNMKEWLESTHDSDHNLDDELEEILSHEADWKIQSQTISRSPSTTHSEEVEEEGKKSARKDTPKANAIGKANAIDILALTETWEKHEGGSDYSKISKYRYIGFFPNKQPNRGTGFLISNKTRDRESPKSVKNQDPNIGWIQFIDATQTYYIATVYVPYGIKKQAKKIYQTLMLN